MQKIGGGRRVRSSCVGILLAIVGVGLMGFGIWRILPTLLLFLGVCFLVCRDQLPTSNFQERPALERHGIYLKPAFLIWQIPGGSGRPAKKEMQARDEASVTFSLTPVPAFRLDLTTWASPRWPNYEVRGK